MPTNSKSRRLGKICRIYKNSASSIIALESVDVNVNSLQKADKTFHRSVSSIDTSRQILHLVAGGSRVVASIQTIGDYSSIEENGGNYLITTWDAASSNENDVVISLENHVAKVGDTI